MIQTAQSDLLPWQAELIRVVIPFDPETMIAYVPIKDETGMETGIEVYYLEGGSVKYRRYFLN